MRELTSTCSQVWVASAFLGENAVDDLFDAAERGSSKVHLLTGTFGNSTRRRTFQTLLKRCEVGGHEVRVWHDGTHGDFHAKLLVWRGGNGLSTAWIGSANLTEGGLQNTGEVMLQVVAPWSAPIIRRLWWAFKREWRLGAPLSVEFVRTYREAKRTAFGHRFAKRTLPTGGHRGRRALAPRF